MNDDRPATSLAHLDLDAYLGLWHEIGRLPLKWEDAEARDITAHYSLQDDGAVRVDNRCLDATGSLSQSIGRATRVDGEEAQLKVSFAPAIVRWLPFTQGDYWVLKIDAGYQHALVGTPDHANLWLLARTPHVSPAIEQEFLDEAVTQGFDLTDWIRPQQSGAVVSDDQLD